MGRDRFGLLWFFKYIKYITRTSWLWAVLFMKIEIKIIVDCKARWDAWGPRAPPGRGVQLAKAKARAPNWPRSCRSALSRVFRAHAPLVSVYSVIWSGCGYQRQIGKVTALGTRICGYSSCSPGSCLSQKLYMLYMYSFHLQHYNYQLSSVLYQVFFEYFKQGALRVFIFNNNSSIHPSPSVPLFTTDCYTTRNSKYCTVLQPAYNWSCWSFCWERVLTMIQK